LEQARKTLADIDEELRPMVEEYNETKNAADAIQDLRKKIEDLKNKADEAERKYDLASASGEFSAEKKAKGYAKEAQPPKSFHQTSVITVFRKDRRNWPN
jgi:hypothetical protein